MCMWGVSQYACGWRVYVRERVSWCVSVSVSKNSTQRIQILQEIVSSSINLFLEVKYLG